MKNLTKMIIILCIPFTLSIADETNDGLKVENFKNQEIDSKQSDKVQQISPKQRKKLNESLKKAKDYLKERQKFLDELDNEDK